MADVIQVKSQQLTLSTSVANTVANAALVRLFNTASQLALITVRDSANNVLGSFTLGQVGNDGSVEFIRKNYTDTLTANVSGVSATSVGYY